MNRFSVVLRKHGAGVALKAVLCLVAAVTALIGSAPSAQSADALINLQFGGSDATAYTGAAVIGSEGDFWNLKTGGSKTNTSLLSSTGANTGVTVSFTSQYFGAVSPDQPGSFGFYGTSYADLMQGYIYAFDGTPRSISFSGLAASSSYSVYVYTQGDSGATDRQLTITTNGTTYTALPSVATESTFVASQNYLALTGISDAQGVLTLTYNFAAGEANINAVQVNGPVAVPEPSTCLLLGVSAIAGIGLLRRRRS
ncbi:PEP-CTERM protein-sorting domain-containing protein [Terrimicrobium sacchariphilum]|uniref:PEP-CTERM protein-sorting domain-containing protein n=1 Tax=Terrimicrobium sacchariphilum TaxID=690879 RepID=A0A146G6X8_TERSA|nr:PEP-CTERM sorting domain-containing protein [Terrimicrobium sacchariphilum]GAT32528.1 PEP-CTERM protein-sorting domain-containing protein [Terrimicrobium sacchariphilum]